MKRLKYVFIILTVLWMIVIVVFSAKNGSESVTESKKIVMLVANMVVPGFEQWSEKEQMEFVQQMNYPMRKVAHMTEYAILGSFLTVVCYLFRKKTNYAWLIPWILGTLYAMTDEAHQVMVPGRDGKMTDVLIDSIGVFVGALIVTGLLILIQKIIANARQKRKSPVTD